MNCPFAHDDGAYVLGALSPADRLAFERHLPSCADCTRSIGELAGLPGLLGRVPPEVVRAQQAEEPVPAALLANLTRQVRVERRRRTWLVAGGSAAAAALVVTVGAVAAGIFGADAPGTATPSVSTSAEVATGQEMVPVGKEELVADLAMTSVAWGTKLALTCSYDDTWVDSSDDTYSLVVVTRAGTTEKVATWHGLPGKTMHLDAATATRLDDVASFEVQSADGTAVLQLVE